MTTQTLLEFYDKVLGGQVAAASLFTSFDIVVASPGTTGSKGGLVVDQLTTPGRMGRIKAVYAVTDNLWQLTTSNIHRFHFSAAANHDWTKSTLVIDGETFELHRDVRLSDQWLIHNPDESWEVRNSLVYEFFRNG